MRIAPETWHLVDQLLRDQWSPEQISGWLSHTQSVRVSHEWIYQYVLRDKLAGDALPAFAVYFPKHRRFATITQEEIQIVMNQLNNRPRKSLGFQTPNQVCFGITPSVALAG